MTNNTFVSIKPVYHEQEKRLFQIPQTQKGVGDHHHCRHYDLTGFGRAVLQHLQTVGGRTSKESRA